MKNLFYGLMLVSTLAVAQDDKKQTYTLEVTGNAAEKWLVIDNLSADLIIEGTSGSEIKIDVKNYEGLPERAKGLKPLSASGPENTGIGLSVSQEGNTISISGAHNEANNADYYLYLPKNLKLKLNYNGWQTGNATITQMAGEIEARSQVGRLVFKDVTGPLVANSLSSNIEVIFSEVSGTSPTSLSSTSGDIDVAIPANTKATFKMSTISGGVYTAFDFDLGDSKLNQIGGQNATGKLNGGGVDVTLKTISGNIYVRKPE